MGLAPRFSRDQEVVCLEEARSTSAEIAAHLQRCDLLFEPRLSTRLDIVDYARKIHEKAITFEAWCVNELVGVAAVYLNDPAGESGYVTSVSIEAGFQRKGLAASLMQACIERAREKGFKRISLEVGLSNGSAIGVYRRLGFEETGRSAGCMTMELALEREKRRDK